MNTKLRTSLICIGLAFTVAVNVPVQAGLEDDIETAKLILSKHRDGVSGHKKGFSDKTDDACKTDMAKHIREHGLRTRNIILGCSKCQEAVWKAMESFHKIEDQWSYTEQCEKWKVLKDKLANELE